MNLLHVSFVGMNSCLLVCKRPIILNKLKNKKVKILEQSKNSDLFAKYFIRCNSTNKSKY